MKKLKLRLENFESEQEKVLAPAFLSKILGGDGGSSTTPETNESTSPKYTLSLQGSIEVERDNES